MVSRNDTTTAVDMEAFKTWAYNRNQKFTVEDIEEMPRLYVTAVQYVESYKGKFDYLIDVQLYLSKNGTVTMAQAKGVLNCVLAEVRREWKIKNSRSARARTPRGLEPDSNVDMYRGR